MLAGGALLRPVLSAARRSLYSSLWSSRTVELPPQRTSWRPLRLLSTSSPSWRASPSLRSSHAPATSTIFALASGRGQAGIAVIRISGPQASHIYRLLCRRTLLPPGHRLVLRNLYHPHTLELLDRAALVWFPEGESYTGEASLELHVHGGSATVRDTLDALADLGVGHDDEGALPLAIRPAEPGEFTRRAYLNGKLDLTSSEALHSLITSSTSSQRKLALQGAGGAQTRRYEAMRASLLDAMAMVEALIDFSDEEGVEPHAWQSAQHGARQIQRLIESELGLEDSSQGAPTATTGSRKGGTRHVGEILSQGVRLAIYGPPNAGKSSLLNALADREAAIVSDVPGTTRDVVQVDLDLGGFKVVAFDTAGIRSDDDVDRIEQIGIQRAHQAVASADLALLVFPAPELDAAPDVELPILRPDSYGPEDEDLVLFSKSDLVPSPSSSPAAVRASNSHTFLASTRTDEGLHQLVSGLTSILQSKYGHHLASDSIALVTQPRHRFHLLECHDALVRFAALARHPDPDLVMAAEELREAANALGEVTGIHIRPDEVLGKVFGSFCIGK
ncbi:mitochondrial splicing system protein [Thecaphora frezii]